MLNDPHPRSPRTKSIRIPLSRLFPAVLASLQLTAACAPIQTPPPTRELALRHVVLYQNGMGYFERRGALTEDKLRLHLRSHEIDDVLKTLVVIEQGQAQGAEKPSTVTVRLPNALPSSSEETDETTWLDVVLSPRPTRELSIAYAVPTAAWKAAYRIVLPEKTSELKSGNPKGALLQAWALIDNVSDEDWNGISLTLATGAPLSFVTNLRSPRFIKRPGASYPFGDENSPTGPIYSERVPQTDTDNDGIADAQDRCPSEPGTPNADPSKTGCPRALVVLTEASIRILQYVHFDKDKSVIKRESFPILDQVVDVLRSHPEIQKVIIEGHASQGEKNGWNISLERATAVKLYLTNHGVTTALETQGFGDSRPLDTNTTEDGRTKNRRVTFRIEKADNQAPTVPAGIATPAAVEKSAPSQAALRDISGSVRYDITHPVTIPKNSSTLVTIINEYVPGEDIFLFRPDGSVPGSERYPMRAARMENKSGFGLQPGPVAIFGGGTFVGEGLLSKLNPGDSAMIPYGIDSSTEVEKQNEDKSTPIRLLSLIKGMLTVEDARIVTSHYQIRVGHQAPERIFIRHPRLPGFSAENLPPSSETLPDSYIIPIPIRSKTTSTLSIEEKKPVRQNIDIFNLPGKQLEIYLAGRKLDAESEKRVREIASLRKDIERLEQEMNALRAELSELSSRAFELRESIKAIEKTPRVAAFQQKLVDRLAETTKQTEERSTKLNIKTIELAEARAKLNENVRDITIPELQ